MHTQLARRFFLVVFAMLLAACERPPPQESGALDETWVSRSISELRADLDAGRVTSVELVRAYRARIEALNRNGPKLHAIIAINPDAEKQAAELDRELKKSGARGPLHGIPVAIKDNIETADGMPTTAGSLALAENFAKSDAPIVARLRAAGAVILAKANLSEWANFRSPHSTSGWSAVGGLARSPHVLDRSACGSSSGTAVSVAALLAPGGVGTETDGSITCPSSMNGLVGLKPTLGLLSQQGIVPIAHSQDTAGPMARNVTDAAIMLAAMVERAKCVEGQGDCEHVDYVKALSQGALQGKRIGVWRFRAGTNPHIVPVYEQALQVLREAGATLIDVETPDVRQVSGAEFTVLLTEFKADLNAYLAHTPATVATRTLEQLIEFNKKSPAEMALFGQEFFEQAQSTKGLDDAAYLKALNDSKRLAREAIDGVLSANKLDFIVAPTNGLAWRIDTINGDNFTGSFSTLPAVSGYPHLTVPMGDVRGLPVGLSFIGPANSDAALLSAGFAYEQRAGVKVKPLFKPTVDNFGE